MKWSAHHLNKNIAPEITKFTKADIPDLDTHFPQAKYWLQNHFLNVSFRGTFKAPARQVTFGYLRRVHHAFSAYHEARSLTLKYLDGNDPENPKIQAYYDAVGMWEMFALNIAIGLAHYMWMNDGNGAFKKNDGSPEFRLYEIANHVKHFTSCVESGQCTPNEIVPLWLSNTGLNTFGHAVTFDEAAQILTDMSKLADSLQDPLGFVESRKKDIEATA